MPAMSVIICTRDRPDTIKQAVESVATQPVANFDVLVVDQSHTSQTQDIIARLTAQYPHVHYLHLDRAGLSRAYNAGIRNTSGELIAFTDDDCVAPPTWLPATWQTFATQQDVGLVYGQVLLPPNMPDPGGAGIIPSLPILQRRRLSRRDGFAVFGMGANFAVRRSIWERVGGFDEVLGGGGPLKSSQDYDFAFRVYRLGATILLEPDSLVYHYGFRSQSDWPATLTAYGVGDGGFYLKHVRAGDLYAARLLARTLVVHGARELVHSLQPRGAQWNYVRGITAGMLRSLRYGVDRRQRLYFARGER
jgi:glycosyltransferase involved in cell wall biosynthesis